METKLLPLTSHCALDVGANVAHTFCPAERAASGVNPSGPGYHGGVVGSRWNLTEQLLQRTWGNRARPSGTEVPREKATPMKRPFLWKESSTAASVEKDCHTVEIRKKRGPLTLPKLDLFVTSKTEKDSKKSVSQRNSQWCPPLRRVLQTVPPSHLTLFYRAHRTQKRIHLHLVWDR